MTSDRKLALCGLTQKTGKHKYKYDENEVYVDFADNVIYVDILTEKSTETIRYLLEQLLGRFKTYKYVNVTAYDDEILLEQLKNSRGLKTNVKDRNILVERHDNPKIYTGIIRDCTIRLANKYTLKHKQIIHVTKDDIYIYFDPPLMYELSGTTGDLSTYIKTPVATCGDPVTHWRPRWNKLTLCVDYDDKGAYVHVTPTYVIRTKMKISLGPSKRGYEEEYKEYKRYARQVLHYLNNCAKRIQRSWRRCISDPSYHQCRKRLQAEYKEMDDDIML
jgi:hypothetical protein